MLRFLNKVRRLGYWKKKDRSSDGQAAIVLILVIAAALIFYAVSLNIGQFTLTRALVTIASNTSASMMASDMASYGQQLSSTNLEGKRRLCASTSLLAAIITLIIVIVVAYFTGGWGLLAYSAIALATLSVILNAMVIQPGITDAWNRIVQATLGMTGQFVENAIRSGFSKAVTDPVQVPDITDADGDGIFVLVSDLNNTSFADTVSRFGLYYSQRLLSIEKAPHLKEIPIFASALKEFLYEGVDGWGIFDPVPEGRCVGKAECHACCVPNQVDVEGDPESAIGNARPEICLTPEPGVVGDDAYWGPLCEAASPYQQSGGVSPYLYAWIFDEHYENPDNDFFSFREQIGRDDEHRGFWKDPQNPNSSPSYEGYEGAGRPSQNIHASGGTGFRMEDATAYYVPPFYSVGADNRKGIHPFFYKVTDWGVDLNRVINNIGTNPNSSECHWCDPEVTNPGACVPCAGYPPQGAVDDHPFEIPPLNLMLDPGNPNSGIIYNTTNFVDGTDANVSGRPPLAADKVTINLPGNIVKENPGNYPALNQPADTLNAGGFWRRGEDRFCRTTYPYSIECASPDRPDDVINLMMYGLEDFIMWAEGFLAAATDIKRINETFRDWYPEAAIWIDPAGGTTPGGENDPGISVSRGILYTWLDEMKEIRNRIQRWRTNNGAGYTGGCDEVWCVPGGGCPVAEGEAETFDTNRNGIRGDIEDVANCLSYNVDGYDYVAADAFKACRADCSGSCDVGVDLPEFYLNGITPYQYPVGVSKSCSGWGPGNEWYDAIDKNIALSVNPPPDPETQKRLGNSHRFKMCATSCSLADCYHLPRSLVPNAIYDPNNYQPLPDPLTGLPLDPATLDANWKDLRALNDCLDNCNPEACRVGVRLPTVHTADGVTPYVYPNPLVTPLNCVAFWGDYGMGNVWYDAIVDAVASVAHPDEADMGYMLRCYDDCLTNLDDCQAMPDFQSSTEGLVPYTWTNGPPLTTFTDLDCDVVTNRPINGWETDIINNVLLAGGASCDLNPGQWLDQTRQSMIEAYNQGAKFAKRRDFLKRDYDMNFDSIPDFTIGVWAGAQNILDVLGEDLDGDGLADGGAIQKFEEFLTSGAVLDLVAKKNYEPPKGKELPFDAIYGWRDEDITQGTISARGKWHIVKVEARMLDMCENMCGVGGGADPGWPRIITYTKRWGTKRCYELINTTGIVKFRATRWDEEATSTPCAGLDPCPEECSSCGASSLETYTKTLEFPNKVPIWRALSFHPQRPLDRNVYNPDNIGGRCSGKDSGITEMLDGSSPPDPGMYSGAFMLTKKTYDNTLCWDYVHGFLASGVVNETCAQYYWHGGVYQGMGIKFIPCPSDF